MSTQEVNKNADALLAEYKIWDLEQNPNGVVMTPEKNFNEPAQIWGEKRRVLRDLKLAELIKAIGQDKFPCVVLTRESAVKGIILTYHTDAAPIECDKVRWVSVPARATTGGQRKYLTYSRDTVLWRVRVLDGNLKQFLMLRLKAWLVSGRYKNERDAFCKDVAKLIRDYPHKDFDFYKKYIGVVCSIVKMQEKSPAFILGVAKEIADNLKSCLYKDAKEGKNADEIWKLVKEKPCIPSVGDCSKNANKLMANFDMAAIKTDEMFEELEQQAKEEEAAAERAMNAMFENENENENDAEDPVPERGVKREREDTEDASPEQEANKAPRLEK